MTKEELIDLFLERGGSYDLETGKVFNSKGKEYSNKPNRRGYVRICVWITPEKRSSVCIHQIIFYCAYGYLPTLPNMIDHINRDKSDNRLSNLREVSNRQNQLNTDIFDNAKKYRIRGPHNSKKYKNIRYIVDFGFNGKKINIGSYETPEEAEKAYDDAMKIYKNI